MCSISERDGGAGLHPFVPRRLRDLDLVQEAAGRDYECLLPAGPVLHMLGINFTCSTNNIQVLASV